MYIKNFSKFTSKKENNSQTENVKQNAPTKLQTKKKIKKIQNLAKNSFSSSMTKPKSAFTVAG